MQTLYRIVDITTQETLAQGIPTQALAQEQLELLELDYPHCFLEIESYTLIDPAVASKT